MNLHERETSEQPDGGAARSAGTGEAPSDEARELHETAATADTEQRALADALRFLDSGDDPEPFAGQFDPFDGFRSEREQDRNGSSAAPAEQFGSIHPPSRQPDAAGRRAAGSISAEEIERLEQEMMEIDASWGGCEPEPVSRTIGERGRDSSRRTGDGEAPGVAALIDTEAARQPQLNQAASESASSSAARPEVAAPPQSGGRVSVPAGRPPSNADSALASGSKPASQSGGRDRESLAAASPEARGSDGIPGQSIPQENDPFGFGSGGDTPEPPADEKSGDPDAEARAFDEVDARMAIRDNAETGGDAGASCSSPQESGTPGEVRNGACEAKPESESGPAVPPGSDRAVPRETAGDARSEPSNGAIEESGPDRNGQADRPSNRTASGLPTKAAFILAAGVAVSACTLAFDRFDIANRLGLAGTPDGGEVAKRHGIPETHAELEDPRGALRSAAGTPSVPDASAASSIAIPVRNLASGAAGSGAALRSNRESLESVAGVDALGKAEVAVPAGIAIDPAAPRGEPSAGSGTGPADADMFPAIGGFERDIGNAISSLTMPAKAEAGREEFGLPFGFPIAGNADGVPFMSGRAAESNGQSLALPSLERKPVLEYDLSAEGCLSDCEAPEARPDTAVQLPQAAAAPKPGAYASIPAGSRPDGAAKRNSAAAASRIDGIKPESAPGAFPSNAFGSGGAAEEGAVGRADAHADANKRISREIAELRDEIDGISRSLKSRIGVIEAELEELGKEQASRHESRDGPSATGEAEKPGEKPPGGTRAGMANELRPGAAVRFAPERAGTYAIATEFKNEACFGSRPTSNLRGTEGFGCGQVLDVVNDGFGGWLVVTESAVFRFD